MATQTVASGRPQLKATDKKKAITEDEQSHSDRMTYKNPRQLAKQKIIEHW